MVHNLIDGMPTEATTTLKVLETANPKLVFGIIGLEGFSERVFKLTPYQIGTLLGPAASPDDAKNLDIATLRKLVNDLAAAANAAQPEAIDLRPVPVDKLAYNQLPNHWKFLISGGWINAPIVASYFERHPDPLTGDKVAALFKGKYTYFKTQYLAPGDITAALFELVTGIPRAGDPRAAQVLATAHAGLQTLADAITDTALRHSFLNDIPEHRELVAVFHSFTPPVAGPRIGPQ